MGLKDKNVVARNRELAEQEKEREADELDRKNAESDLSVPFPGACVRALIPHCLVLPFLASPRLAWARRTGTCSQRTLPVLLSLACVGLTMSPVLPCPCPCPLAVAPAPAHVFFSCADSPLDNVTMPKLVRKLKAGQGVRGIFMVRT